MPMRVTVGALTCVVFIACTGCTFTAPALKAQHDVYFNAFQLEYASEPAGAAVVGFNAAQSRVQTGEEVDIGIAVPENRPSPNDPGLGEWLR